ncbi:hypothetical protein [Bdellovibrio sp. HCB2-146]|uniref:hypothetical protein n=1 Tax=Bdellovibrio sp. HCB2-146 TaxID=3394362 RepID=UPI0039BCBFF4
MAQPENNKMALERLVDELMKDDPNRQLVKQLSKSLGLSYSVDPLTQMNTVLHSMNEVYLKTPRRKDLER